MKQSQLMRVTIPIKILCGCGQKYAFDVEPLVGRIGYTVQCPVCGIDGTAATNKLIEDYLASAAGRASVAPEVDEKRKYGRDAGSPSGLLLSPPRAPDRPRETIIRTEPDPGPADARSSNKGLLAVICFIVAIIVIAILALAVSRRSTRDPSTIATETNDGLPKTLTELNAWYVEPAQNAARFYLQGFDALQLDHVESSNVPLLGQGKLPPLGSATPASIKSAMMAIVRSNGDALRSLAQGSELEQSRYPVNLSLGWDMTLPHVANVRKSASLVELSAILHAEGKDAKQAGTDVLTVLGLARSLEAEPVLISQSVRAMTVTIAVSALEQTINRIYLPKESLAEISKTLQKMEDYEARGEGFNRAIVAERTTSLAMLAAPQKLLQTVMGPGVDIPAEQREQVITLLKKGGSLKKEQQYFEKAFQQLMTVRKKSFPDRLDADEMIRRRVSEASSKKLVVSGMLLPSLGGRVLREAGSLAGLRVGLTAVAMEQFRAAHDNHYPSALSELSPDYLPSILADPFDGQPLRYRTSGNGYVVYSIGPNLKDDSGERSNGKDGDIVFEVATPPKVRDR